MKQMPKRTCVQSFLFLVFFILPFLSFAQSHRITVHPVIGDTIDLEEKKLYLLFPEIPDSAEAVLFRKDSKYYLSTSSGTLVRELKKDELLKSTQNVEKLLEFWSSKSGSDDKGEMNFTNGAETQFSILSPQLRKRIRKDANRYNDLKYDAQDKGLWGKEKDMYIKTRGIWNIYSKE